MADFWAERLIAEGRTSVAGRVDSLFREALGRAPGESERANCIAAVRSLAAAYGVDENGLMASRPVWKDAAHMMFNLKEFIFIP